MSDQSGIGPQSPLIPSTDVYGGRSPFASSTKPPVLQRYVPFTSSTHAYTGLRLRTDAMAGLTVAALALPAGMAYAELAGLPVTAGLYALLLPVLAYAFFGTTPRGVVGPEGAVALLVATALGPLAATGSAEYATLAAALAIAVGVVFVLARLLHLGWVADYFSQSVLVGYITGVAILMALGQLEKLTGLSSQFDGALRAAVDVVTKLGQANAATLAVAAVSLALLVVLGRFLPRWPAALVVVVLGMAASWLLDLQSHGVALTGSIPSGLPSFARPEVTSSQLLSLVGPAVAIFLVSFSDGILTARSFAARHHETVDADQELLAFGLASVASGFTQGMPIGASGSRTAVNDSMNATSQVSGLVSIGSIAAILLFFTAPIAYLPSAVLGAVIVFASLKLLDIEQWRDLARSSRSEVAIAAITALFVITIGVLSAILVAVVLSVLDVIRRTATPDDAVLGYSKQDGRYVDVTDHPDSGVTPGVVVYRIQGRLFFANAHFFKRRLWAAVDGAPRPVRHVVLDAGAIVGIDASAVEALREVYSGLRTRNTTLEVARATAELRNDLAATGLSDMIGV